MKAVERLDRDPSFQEWIDAVVIKTLDLPDHPENIFKYGVKLLVRRQPALERTVHAGSREGVPEFVQLVKATRVDLENIHASTDWHTLDGMSRREQIDPVLLRVRISWELYDFAGAVLDTLKCFSPLHVEMVLPLIPKGPDAMERLIMIFNELLRNNGTAEQKQRSQLRSTKRNVLPLDTVQLILHSPYVYHTYYLYRPDAPFVILQVTCQIH